MRVLTLLSIVASAVVLVATLRFSTHVSSAGPTPYGSYPVLMNVLTDPAGHAPFIQMPHEIKLTLVPSGFEDAFLGPAPFVPVDNDVDKDAFGEFEVNMTGSGTVAGHQDIEVSLTGLINDEGDFVGVYTMGEDGDLPGGQPIEYQVKLNPSSPPVTFTPQPTATPTPTLAGPTSTPAPPTSTPAGTPTATAPPSTPIGDANGDGTVNSIDAAIVLQYTAALIGPPSNSDVNGDSSITAVDAALILQYDAGLIDSLPA
jgi:hypothetical protein